MRGSEGVVTDRVRVVPVTQHPRTVCLRLELCGCVQAGAEQQQPDRFEGVHDEVPDLTEELQLLRPAEDTAAPSLHPAPGLMSAVIGVLVTVILLLTAVIVFILCHSGSSSSTVTSVPQYDCTYHPLPPSDYVSQYSSDCSDYSRPLLGAYLK